jgi:hypothetical protein
MVQQMSPARRRRLAARPLLGAMLFLLTLLAGNARPATAAQTYALNLYRQGDFVRQANLVQCVGTSMQMMINVLETSNDRTASTQLRLQTIARRYSDLISPRPGRRGASVWGWAAGLNELGYGPYHVAGYPTIDAALAAAARAIRFTGRPVGLLMWRGRHAWVMTGFRATADPRTTARFRVTDVNVVDPLYPTINPTWGASPSPGQRLSVATLGRQFVARRTTGGSSPGAGSTIRNRLLGGPFVIVEPFDLPAVRGLLAS